MARVTKIAPSILSADFACLADDVARVATEADLLHVDVMDGHFVPNLTIGPPVVAALRARTPLFLDCHLMVDNPAVLLADFAEAGADRCIVHIEVGDPRPLFAELRERGVGVGLTLSPETPVDAVLPFLGEIDLLLVMSVHPGFGGQAFIPDVLDKVRVAPSCDRRGRAPRRDRDRRRDQARHRAGGRHGRGRHPGRGQRDLLRARSRGCRARDPRRGATRCLSDAVPGHPLMAKVLTVSDGVVAGRGTTAPGRRSPSGSSRRASRSSRTRCARTASRASPTRCARSRRGSPGSWSRRVGRGSARATAPRRERSS